MKLSKPTFLNSANLRLTLILFVYSVVVLFFLSPDSYLRDLYCRADSSVFFTCGKAWMNGMVPYVDFSDSKGPLLWLIYGVGYLLNHHSYVGVFWISTLFYTATLFFAYKLSRLFVDKKVAAVVVAFLPLFLFFYRFHFEVRAEDFCNTFVMLSLYCVCRILKRRETSTRLYTWLSAGIGGSFMCCLLIKYNIAVMLLSLMVIVFIVAVRSNRTIVCLKGLFLGAVAPALPFVICFVIRGNIGAFMQEYFLNTFRTILIMSKQENSSLPIAFIISDIFGKSFILIMLGTLLMCWRYKIGYWLFPCLLFFLLLSSFKGGYYWASVMPFSLFFIIPVIDIIISKVSWHRCLTPAICLIVAALSVIINVRHINTAFKDKLSERQNYYKASYVMSQIKDPKVLGNRNERSVGMPAGTLPCGRYWIEQSGATKEMIAERTMYVKQGIPDFICVSENSNDSVITNILQQYGYVFYCMVGNDWYMGDVLLYGRPGLRLPPDDFYVSQWDVWLKRNIFGI